MDCQRASHGALPLHELAGSFPRVAELRRPWVVRGGASAWSACGALQPGALAAGDGAVEVVAQRSGGPATLRAPLSEFAAGLEAGRYDGWYATNLTFRDTLPEVAEGIDLPGELANWLDVLPDDVGPEWLWLFLGGAGTATPLHVDVMLTSAWNALAYGIKVWSFLSPARARGLLPRQVAATPLGGDDVAYWSVQEPGDVVLTPSGWAHEVRNVTSTVAVTGNYVNASNFELVRAFLETQDDRDLVELLDAARAGVVAGP